MNSMCTPDQDEFMSILSIQQQQMNNMLWFAIISLNLNLLFGWAGWVVWWM